MKIFFRSLTVLFLLLLAIPHVSAQDSTLAIKTEEALKQEVAELRDRVRELEDYQYSIKPRLEEWQKRIENNNNEFQANLQKNLQEYVTSLQNHLDTQIRSVNDRSVLVDVLSKEYTKIETNSGSFIIGVKKIQPLANNAGYRVTIHLGNPNFASYRGLKFNLTWGEKWDENSRQKYEEWRQTLTQGKYTHSGKVNQGSWAEVDLDIPAASMKQLAYVECSMDVESVELNLKGFGL